MIYSIIRTILLLIIYLLPLTISAQNPDKAVFANRRAELCKSLNDGLMLLYGNEPVTRNGDVEYSFRQSSDFYYLTGVEKPNVIMLLVPHAEKKYILFLEETDFFEKLFSGEGLTIEKAMSEFGADTAFTVDQFDDIFTKCFRGKKKLFYDLKNPAFNEKYIEKNPGHRFRLPEEVINPANIIHEMRVFKDKHEVTMLRKAIGITCESIAEVMKVVKPGKTENEMQGIIEYVWRKKGIERFGFPSIIAAGKNTAILHYEANNGPINDGDLIMMDIGCEYGYYSADVTRTFPANGKFSKEQKELYEVALSSLQAAIDAMKPGIGFNEINQITIDAMSEGLYKLGLITDKNSKWQVSVYYPYFFGHFLGLDIHDVGDQRGNSPKGRIYEPGMVIAVEPGIYVNPENFEMLPQLRRYLPGLTEEAMKEFMDTVRPVVEKYAYICVRAEDDVLITENGNTVLSEKLPKSVEEIEKLMKEKTIFE